MLPISPISGGNIQIHKRNTLGGKQKNHSIAREDNDKICEESQEDNENSDNVSDN
jgi:hypothetical protein